VFPLAGGVARDLVSPSVSELDVLHFGRHHENWLDGKRHPRTHLLFARAWVSVMVHHRRHMKTMGNPMPAEILVDEITVGPCVVLDDLSDLIVSQPWLAALNRNVHCLTSDL
jgi:hypothetical protein